MPSGVVPLVACTMGIAWTGGARPVWKLRAVQAMGCFRFAIAGRREEIEGGWDWGDTLVANDLDDTFPD